MGIPGMGIPGTDAPDPDFNDDIPLGGPGMGVPGMGVPGMDAPDPDFEIPAPAAPAPAAAPEPAAPAAAEEDEGIAEWWYLSGHEKLEKGPVTVTRLSTLLKRELITPDTEVRSEQGGFAPLKSIRQLRWQLLMDGVSYLEPVACALVVLDTIHSIINRHSSYAAEGVLKTPIPRAKRVVRPAEVPCVHRAADAGEQPDAGGECGGDADDDRGLQRGRDGEAVLDGRVLLRDGLQRAATS